jgi:hypothetical protein
LVGNKYTHEQRDQDYQSPEWQDFIHQELPPRRTEWLKELEATKLANKAKSDEEKVGEKRKRILSIKVGSQTFFEKVPAFFDFCVNANES